MAKVLTQMTLTILDTTGDPATPDTSAQVTYIIADDTDAELQKHKAVQKTIDTSETIASEWASIKSDIDTDEGLS